MANWHAIAAVRFSELELGSRFIFKAERDQRVSGMALGPWVKLGSFTYRHESAGGPVQRVGRTSAWVLPIPERSDPVFSVQLEEREDGYAVNLLRSGAFDRTVVSGLARTAALYSASVVRRIVAAEEPGACCLVLTQEPGGYTITLTRNGEPIERIGEKLSRSGAITGAAALAKALATVAAYYSGVRRSFIHFLDIPESPAGAEAERKVRGLLGI